MDREKAIVIVNLFRIGQAVDVEVPLTISANEFTAALNRAFNLGIDTTDNKSCYLKAENPIALLRGDKTLAEFGVRNGTRINITE